MNKNQFIEQLRTALTGEVPNEEIIHQINYYDNYITSQSVYKSQEKVIEELGNPNLIAKTIIDAYIRKYGTSNHGKYKRQADRSNDFSYYQTSNGLEEDSRSFNKQFQINKIPWYVKVIFIVFVITLLMLLIFLGTIVVRLLMFLFPAIIALLIILIVLKSIRD